MFLFQTITNKRKMTTMATKASPPPPWKAMLPKCALEIFGFFLLCLPLAYIYVFARPHEPFQRGFFCDDENLKHPYVDDQVSTAVCFLTWVTLSALVILPVELLRTGGRCEAGIRAAVVELYEVSGPYILGALSCMVATDSAKFSVGRLRPHFLTLCRPDFNRTGLCRDSWGYHRSHLHGSNSFPPHILLLLISSSYRPHLLQIFSPSPYFLHRYPPPLLLSLSSPPLILLISSSYPLHLFFISKLVKTG